MKPSKLNILIVLAKFLGALNPKHCVGVELDACSAHTYIVRWAGLCVDDMLSDLDKLEEALKGIYPEGYQVEVLSLEEGEYRFKFTEPVH